MRKLIITILNQWGYTWMIIKSTIQKIFQKFWKVKEIWNQKKFKKNCTKSMGMNRNDGVKKVHKNVLWKLGIIRAEKLFKRIEKSFEKKV